MNKVGAESAGETGTTGSAAIGDAIWHVTGRRFPELPIVPNEVVAVLP